MPYKDHAKHLAMCKIRSQKHYVKNREALLNKYKRYRLKHHAECLLKDKIRNRSLAGRFGICKGRSKRRGFEWMLTKEQYAALLAENKCHYCRGVLPETAYGLDRKDSTKGYTLDNVVPCCKNCNSMKNHLVSYEEMKLLWFLRHHTISAAHISERLSGEILLPT